MGDSPFLNEGGNSEIPISLQKNTGLHPGANHIQLPHPGSGSHPPAFRVVCARGRRQLPPVPVSQDLEALIALGHRGLKPCGSTKNFVFFGSPCSKNEQNQKTKQPKQPKQPKHRPRTEKFNDKPTTRTTTVLWMVAKWASRTTVQKSRSKTLVSDESPVNTSEQWFFLVSKWCEMDCVHH